MDGLGLCQKPEPRQSLLAERIMGIQTFNTTTDFCGLRKSIKKM